MLDYLISLLDFTIDGTTYNLITTPWLGLQTWITRYNAVNPNNVSSQVRDAYYDMAKFSFMTSILVVVLIIVSAYFVYKIASGFTGWFRFR